MKYIALYLSAIVLANISAAIFGPAATVFNAFAFIGLDLTSRDKLHEAWHGNHLLLKMGLLIATGSGLSWLLTAVLPGDLPAALVGRIAQASCLSFALAAAADTVVYQALYGKQRLVKINGSNLVSSLVDSVVFPTVAFGSVMPWIMLGQFLAKTCGGFIWSLILDRKNIQLRLKLAQFFKADL